MEKIVDSKLQRITDIFAEACAEFDKIYQQADVALCSFISEDGEPTYIKTAITAYKSSINMVKFSLFFYSGKRMIDSNGIDVMLAVSNGKYGYELADGNIGHYSVYRFESGEEQELIAKLEEIALAKFG